MGRGRPRTFVAPCKYCLRQFKRLEHLQRHERTHTREKPFSCDCGQKFSRQDLLSRHQRLSHAQDYDSDCSINEEGNDLDDLEDDDNDDISTAENNDEQVISPEDKAAPPELSVTHSATEDGSIDLTRHSTNDDGTTPLVYSVSTQMPVEPQSPNVDMNLSRDGLDQQTSDQPSYHIQQLPTTSLTDNIGGDEFGFLWNDLLTGDQPLPVHFFDTDLSLVDVSQQYAAASAIPRHTPVEDGQFTASVIGDKLPSTLALITGPTAISNSLTSRLPSLEPETRPTSLKEQLTGPETSSRTFSGITNHQTDIHPWRIPVEDYQKLCNELSAMSVALPPNYQYPSRHTLSRYLQGYFRGFHDHLPFLHTANISAASLGIELVLSLAAVGALYRFEHARGYELYRVARSLVNHQIDRWNDEGAVRLTSSSPGYAGFATSLPHGPGSLPNECPREGLSPAVFHRQRGLRLLQSLIVLMALASWGDGSLIRDALSIASQAAMFVRELGIGQLEEKIANDVQWKDWIKQEERRRTLFVAYVLFNLQCIAYHVPPLLPNQEISTNLPASAALWDAKSEKQWSQIWLTEYFAPKPFLQALQDLFSGEKCGPVSAFGNYVLIHGLFQQIYFAHNASSLFPKSLGADFTKSMETALRNWQESWESTYGSTLDPSSPKGPIGFNSTALLRLVYIRLNVNTGPKRHLMSRNPSDISSAFANGNMPLGQRSPHLDRAVLQCIHALSVPVRVGIAFVARTQTFNWSVQHALSNLECALLLTHWLRSIAHSIEAQGASAIRSDEYKLLDMVISLVRETEWADTLGEIEHSAGSVRQLAVSTMRLWAETFKGFQVFEMVHIVGSGLSLVSGMLADEAKNTP